MKTAECLLCNVCDTPGRFAESAEVCTVRSNVREFRHESFTVWRCGSCGSLHARDDVDLEPYYANYVVKNQRLDAFTRIAFCERLKWLSRCGLSKQDRILEYGCGNGLFVEYLTERGFDFVRGYDRYVPRFADESWRECRYDAIFSYDVIEHVDDPRTFLVEQAARLEPGGLLSVCTPNAAGIGFTERDETDLHQPYHRHILSLKALVELGTSLGLQSTQTSRSCWMDSRVPFVNWRFVASYIHRRGNVLDVVFEPPNLTTILTSPTLMFAGLFGSWLPSQAHMRVSFRKSNRLV